MEFLQYFQAWVKGELIQAKIMLFFGAITIICLVFVFRSDYQIVKGITIPLCLTTIALIVYGGFMIPDRNNRLSKIETASSQELSLSIKAEKIKIGEGIATCKITIKVWAAVVIAGIILFFFFDQPYYKGIAIGLIILGVSLLLIDVFIDKRAKILYTYFTLNSPQ